MSFPSIVVLDAATLDCGDLDLSVLSRFGRVAFYPLSQPHEVATRMAEAEIVLSNKAKIDAASLQGAARLKLIQICATGTNNVDLRVARERGVQVCNVAGYSTNSVVQHTLCFILNWATQIHRYAAEAQGWPQSPMFVRLDHPIVELAGRTLGLIGAGHIGSEVGRLAEAFGMRVQAMAREGAASAHRWSRAPLRQLLETSDVVSLHCPLNDQTRHIINRETLGWMKPDALLVNTGRGPLVDEVALKEALLARRIGAAALDVLSTEPPPADHPLLDPAISNLMITPHTAWASREARRRLLGEILLNLEAFRSGKERNRVF